jgi:hypothetical protein
MGGSVTPTIPRVCDLREPPGPLRWPTDLDWLAGLAGRVGVPLLPELAGAIPALVDPAPVSVVRIRRIEEKSLTEDKTSSTFGESVSAKYGHSATACPKARRGQWFRGKESGREYRFDLLTCQRRTCPKCHRYLVAADAHRLERRFDGLPMFQLEVTEEAFEAARKRVRRRDGLCVGVPAPGGQRVVLSTVPATRAGDGAPVEVPVEDRRAVLRDLAAHRPVDGRNLASSRTRPAENGQENRAGSWLAEVNPQREPLEYSGHDTSKADTATVEALAAEMGLPVTRVIDAPEVKALRLEAHPLDPRVEGLKRRLGFTEPRGERVELKYAPDGSLLSARVTGRRARSAPLAADWHDDRTLWHPPRVQEEPPLSAYPGFEEVAA